MKANPDDYGEICAVGTRGIYFFNLLVLNTLSTKDSWQEDLRKNKLIKQFTGIVFRKENLIAF